VGCEQVIDGGKLAKAGVAVEKLLPAKFAKIKLRQDVLQTTFSVFLNIFYPPIFRRFEENGLFQQPQAFTRFDRWSLSTTLKTRTLSRSTVRRTQSRG